MIGLCGAEAENTFPVTLGHNLKPPSGVLDAGQIPALSPGKASRIY